MVKCCVPYCYNASYKKTPEISFHRNKDCRRIWCELLTPHAESLRGRGAAYLLNLSVCLAHFERQYLLLGGAKPRRKRIAFPTLFTAEEISSGQPAVAFVQSDVNVYTVHGYEQSESGRKRRLPASEAGLPVSSTANVVAGGSRDSAFLPNSEAQLEEPTPSTSGTTLNPGSSREEYLTVPSAPIPPASGVLASVADSQEGVTSSSKRIRLTKSIRTMTPKCKKMYKKCQEIMKCKRRLQYSYEDRLTRASKLNENSSFRKMFEQMSPQAQTFLNIQMSQYNRHIKRRRFNVEEKLLALSLSRQSPKGYKFLRKLFILPSRRILNKFIQNVRINPGVNPKIFTQLKESVKHWKRQKKFCSIVFDEMSISSYLKFIESEDRIDGFVDFGEEAECKFADHVLVFMVRGICGSWRQSIAYYFCEGTTPYSTMKNILRDIVAAVAETGLMPMALVCDQGSTFQRAVKSFQSDAKREQILNEEHLDDRLIINGHKLHIIYDPPHLIKGIRNNFLTKDMVFKGKLARWSDIVEVYKEDCAVGEIRILKHLTDEHVIPEKIKKMKVRNCTQALSERVCAAMRYSLNKTGTHRSGAPVSASMEDTSNAVLFFDKLFDSVNGSRSGYVRGKMRGPVREVRGQSDHVAFWKEAISILRDLYFTDLSTGHALPANHRRIQVPSVQNWITTLESFIKIWSDLKEANVKFFYTRNLNQDPIENMFGRIRALNYRNNRPDVFSFKCAFKSLLLNDILAPHSSSFNCEDDAGRSLVNPLKFFVEPDSVLPSSVTDSTTSNSAAEHPSTSYAASRPGPERIPSLFDQARRERIASQISAYPAGYVSRRLSQKFGCSSCKKTYLTSDHGDIHNYISARERHYLKGKNLKYPSIKLVLLFRKLVELINQHLNQFAHCRDIVKKIRTKFLNESVTDWFGCEQHRTDALEFFIKIGCRIQIHNFTHTINNILRGSYLERLTPPLPRMQGLALDKYRRSAKFKK